MKSKQRMCLGVGGLALLAGCGGIGNVTDWADKTFYQSQTYAENDPLVKKYLRGIRLYDQFETIAIFDVLWNSDEIGGLYARMYSKMMGKDEEGERAFLRRQLSANTYYMTFYVLSMNEYSLIAIPPTWVMYIEVDGKRYLPSDIKVFELPGEYIRFFGKRITKHKQSYCVKFDRKDANGKDILTGAKTIKYVFSSPHYFGCVGWELDEQGNAIDKVLPDRPPVVPAPVVSRKQRSLGKREKNVQATASAQLAPAKVVELPTPEVDVALTEKETLPVATEVVVLNREPYSESVILVEEEAS